VLDHYQALVSAIGMKLGLGREAAHLKDAVGGSTWSRSVFDESTGALVGTSSYLDTPSLPCQTFRTIDPNAGTATEHFDIPGEVGGWVRVR
jgi:hypothetical protein